MTRRLLLSYLGVACLILLVLEVPFGVLQARHERQLVTAQVAQEATSLSLAAENDVDGGNLALLRRLVDQYRIRTGGDVSVVDAHGHVLAAADPGGRDTVGVGRTAVTGALAGTVTAGLVVHGHRATAVAASPVGADARPAGAVLLLAPAGPYLDRTEDTWLALAGFAGGVLVLTCLVGLALARSLTRPVARLQAAVTELGAGHLAARADDGHGPAEMRALAGRFNQMAARIEQLIGAQSQFVADASHQLRSPLTALRLRLENLEAEVGDADGVAATNAATGVTAATNAATGVTAATNAATGVTAAASVAAAGREVQRLSRLVDGLLVLNRAEQAPPDRRPVDIRTVIAERCEAWEALAAERHIALRTTDGTDRAPVAALVPGDLDQVLDNLLANALDASPGHAGIRVELRQERGASVTIHVADQGPGMSGPDRERAFDRFWQGAGQRGGNSGLGLAIVRQLGERNDLTVRLDPAPGGGLDAVVVVAAQPASRAAPDPVRA